MPELPDLTVYLEHLDALLTGGRLLGVRLASPFVLRSVDPPLAACAGKRVLGFSRLGKRLVFSLEDELFLVLHLMIAGRLRWAGAPGAKIPGKVGVCAFDVERADGTAGTLVLTEASPKKRASLHVVKGRAALADHDPGGLEPHATDAIAFRAALTAERHTLKRALTDPRTVAGIGNTYSDEILHRARLSPVAMTTSLDDDEHGRLYQATRAVLAEWTARLRDKASGQELPEKVTAFHDEMAVHGRAGKPCPVCGSPVQKIAHASNETNYCATCQTGGRLLADRALSRLLKEDWPRTVEELEALKRSHRGR
ncbi:MAG: formamidopyrimidine-DNA glycosylase [Deltaproteobacteria bacterium]|nr:formamidopyrimidine-DNA glycosylase [Deltaproteobacteria bacterium]